MRRNTSADYCAVGSRLMAAYNAVVYAAAAYGTGNAAKRVIICCLLCSPFFV